MQGRNLNLAVGAFVLLGLMALLFMALQVSNLSTVSSGSTYELKAYFDNIGGLDNIKDIIRQIQSMYYATTDARMDGFVTWGVKQDLYKIKWLVDQELAKCPTFAGEEEFLKEMQNTTKMRIHVLSNSLSTFLGNSIDKYRPPIFNIIMMKPINNLLLLNSINNRSVELIFAAFGGII